MNRPEDATESRKSRNSEDETAGCCAASELASCCEQSAKGGCCGPQAEQTAKAPVSCGCR